MGEHVAEWYPAVDEITDADLRRGVRDAWQRTVADTDVRPDEFSWTKAAGEEYGEWSLVAHTNQVVTVSRSIADAFASLYDQSLSTDVLLAGALVHDIGKPYELATGEYDVPPAERLIGHPYFGLYPVLAADLPVEVAHVVLAHSRHCPVESATPEARVVDLADELVAEEARRNMRAEGLI